MNLLKKSQGQTLIEATIALASILLTLAGISVAIMTSVSNSQFIKNQSLASKYAQQGMEHMTYLRTTESPEDFENRSGIYCMGPSGHLSTTPGTCARSEMIDGAFIREVEFDQNSIALDCGGGTKITVEVSWISGKCDANVFCHKSELVSCFNKQSQKARTL